jgi:hypothetical protein
MQQSIRRTRTSRRVVDYVSGFGIAFGLLPVVRHRLLVLCAELGDQIPDGILLVGLSINAQHLRQLGLAQVEEVLAINSFHHKCPPKLTELVGFQPPASYMPL